MEYFYEKLGSKPARIVHHIDMDGYMAAAEISLDPWGDPSPSIDLDQIQYIPMNYNYAWDFEWLRDADVVIVDVSFTKSSITNLFKICEIAHEVRWVDHHQSSKEAIETPTIKETLDGFDNLQYVVNTELCGAALVSVLNYLHKSNYPIKAIEHTKRKPNSSEITGIDRNPTKYFYVTGAIMLIDQWDRFTWKNEREGEKAMYLNNAFYASDYRLPLDPKKKSFYTMSLDDLLKIGKILTNAKDFDRRRCLSDGFHTTITVHGKRYATLIANAAGINPTAHKENQYDKYKCDVFIIWRYSGRTNKFIYSIYTNEGISAPEIAQFYNPNGGGHPNAAGFECDKLLFVPGT